MHLEDVIRKEADLISPAREIPNLQEYVHAPFHQERRISRKTVRSLGWYLTDYGGACH